MKKIASLMFAFLAVLSILLWAVADVNHGHGPDDGSGQEEEDSGGH